MNDTVLSATGVHKSFSQGPEVVRVLEGVSLVHLVRRLADNGLGFFDQQHPDVHLHRSNRWDDQR